MRNKVCGGCYISLPSGQLADMLQTDKAVQICGNCSIYILPGDPVLVVETPAAIKKAATKAAPRKRKVKIAESPVTEEAS